MTLLLDLPSPVDFDPTTWPIFTEPEPETVTQAVDRMAEAAGITQSIPVVSSPTAHLRHEGAMAAAVGFAIANLVRFLSGDGDTTDARDALRALRAVAA